MVEITEIAGCKPGFEDCYAIRLAVFVGEQNVPEAEERDEFDAGARHFLARRDGVAAGTLRLLEISSGVVKITRVAVLKFARGSGLGVALMRHAEAVSDAGMLLLDAQVQALAFYEKLGYEAFGEVFMEAGILHRHMRKLRHPA